MSKTRKFPRFFTPTDNASCSFVYLRYGSVREKLLVYSNGSKDRTGLVGIEAAESYVKGKIWREITAREASAMLRKARAGK